MMLPVDGPPARTAWPRYDARAELRADRDVALWITVGLGFSGLVTGLLWWALAPRQDYRVTADGVQSIGLASAELKAGDDTVFVLVMAGLGLVAGVLAWQLRRRRGVAVLGALALGSLICGALAWQLGVALGPAPTTAELQQVGAVVTTPLELRSVAALAVAPFVAVLAYVVGTLFAAGEDLGRDDVPEAAELTGSGRP
ncbi:hypothetical protein [Blastococcus sp. SYSU D00820]